MIQGFSKFCIKNVGLIKPYKGKVEASYLIKLLQSEIFQSYLMKQLDGGIQKFISLSKLRNLLIIIPTLKEQKAIANILSDMDTEISTLEQRRDKLMDLKQGMMQQLLTGQTRLGEHKHDSSRRIGNSNAETITEIIRRKTRL